MRMTQASAKGRDLTVSVEKESTIELRTNGAICEARSMMCEVSTSIIELN